ncbi:GNAT family N-acetyltransferase [Aliikangiella maris]|uniref:GNAT family N-acetyltransferase n=2 Tax=Aliikangiella maris TaxID=3162458 RepID=A0ABV3MNF1_9GAMM
MLTISIKPILAEQTLMIRHRVLWPNQSIEFCRLKEDETALHFGAYFNEQQLIAVASIFIIERSARLRKFATLPEFQNQGVGSQMLRFLLNQLQQQNVDYFWCDARTEAINFYERFGLKAIGDIFYKSQVAYIKMGVDLNTQPN